MVIIYGGIQQDGLILSIHRHTVNTTAEKSKSRPGLEDKGRLQDKKEDGREGKAGRNKTNNLQHNLKHDVNLTQEELLKLFLIL